MMDSSRKPSIIFRPQLRSEKRNLKQEIILSPLLYQSRMLKITEKISVLNHFQCNIPKILKIYTLLLKREPVASPLDLWRDDSSLIGIVPFRYLAEWISLCGPALYVVWGGGEKVPFPIIHFFRLNGLLHTYVVRLT